MSNRSKNKKGKNSGNGNKTYSIITDTIIELLEAGCVPWRQPWRAGPATRSYYGHQYRGINVFLLSSLATLRGLRGAWVTFNQIKKLGGTVKKGEKSVPVVLWRWLDETDDDGESTGKTLPLCRYYRVFSICQTEGIEEPSWLQNEENDSVENIEPIADAQDIWENYPNKPELKIGGDRACYFPALDQICMPDSNRFDSTELYFHTLYHEMTHSTGHQSRLKRFEKEDAASAAFGSESYSREELLAEMGASMMAAEAGISSQKLLENSASYLQSWIRVLKGEPKMVVIAAAQAQKAVDLVLDKKYEDK